MKGLVFVVLFGLVFLLRENNGDPVEDKQALLDFAKKLPHSRSLNWFDNQTSLVCDHWTGITCSDDKTRVVAVRLPGVGFDGPIPPNTISRLSELQILSLRSNNINGKFPSDLTNLKNLSYIYLQFNNLSGPLPNTLFASWENLTVLNLSNNGFNGTVPVLFSDHGSTQLTGLNLANNSLTGPVPDLAQHLPALQSLDLSYNDLSGPVPESLLRRFPESAFRGNSNVSFSPPEYFPPVASPPSSEPGIGRTESRSSGAKLGEAALLGIIAAGGVLAVAALVFLAVVCCSRRRRKRRRDGIPGGVSGKIQKKGDMSPEKVMSRSQDASNRLAFFEGCRYAFDLEDLLRASAEVLGKGTFGTAYKAVLEDAATVVVKRLKDVSAGKRDFEHQMETVGGIRHDNVVELKAYYYSKEEKLMLYDYFPQGSLSAILHGQRGGEEREGVDWDARLRIAIGAARGIARIHAENNGKLVHGNVKASNIFVNARGFGCVSDAGLAAIMSQLAAPVSRAAGYRAPEVSDTRKAGQPSDVYSFGVVLLELLTGKSPIHTTAGDEIVHLVRWVHSVVREEWTDEVFDIELMRHANIEEEMVEMLQIAMSCVVRAPEQRPKMAELAKMIENVRRVENEARPTRGPGSSRSVAVPGFSTPRND